MELEDYERTVGADLDQHVFVPLIQRVPDCADKGSVPSKLFMGNVHWYGDYRCPKDKVRGTSWGTRRAGCITCGVARSDRAEVLNLRRAYTPQT